MSTTGQGGTPGATGTVTPSGGGGAPTQTVPQVRPASSSAAPAPTAPTPTVPSPNSASGSGASTAPVAGAAAGAATTKPPSRPATRGVGQARSSASRRRAPRRVKLAVARVDPWSVMKMSFLLSVAAGVAGVVLTATLWLILSGMGVYGDIDRVVREIQPSTTDPFNIMNYIGFGRVLSLSVVLGVIDIILMTAIATLAAFLYNICSALVGGIQLTLTDD